jgi:hypothetical protein
MNFFTVADQISPDFVKMLLREVLSQEWRKLSLIFGRHM